MPNEVRKLLGGTIKAVWFEVKVVLMTILKGLAHVGTVSNYQTDSRQQAITLDGSVCPFSCTKYCGLTGSLSSEYQGYNKYFKNRSLTHPQAAPPRQTRPFYHHPPPGFRDFIAWFRYQHYPADKDIWAQLKNGWWWLFRVIALYPSTQSPYFLLKFLIMERHDDFMLLNFVNEFKGLQLMTGLMQTLLGLVDVCSCLLHTTTEDSLESSRIFIPGHAYNNTDGTPGQDAWMVPYKSITLHQCAEIGPGKVEGSSWWAPGPCDILRSLGGSAEDDETAYEYCPTAVPFVDFMVKVLLCWFAIYLLKYSHSFGGKLFLDQRLEGHSFVQPATPLTLPQNPRPKTGHPPT